MRSSSSDGDESEPLFPSANDPTNAHNQPQATTFIPELSPPTSQDHPDENGWSGLQDDDMDITENYGSPADGKLPKHVNPGDLSLNVAPSQPPAKEDYETREDAENEPGYAWKNPKAKEEYSRAMEQVVDKDFSLRTICPGSGCFPES